MSRETENQEIIFKHHASSLYPSDALFFSLLFIIVGGGLIYDFSFRSFEGGIGALMVVVYSINLARGLLNKGRTVSFNFTRKMIVIEDFSRLGNRTREIDFNEIAKLYITGGESAMEIEIYFLYVRTKSGLKINLLSTYTFSMMKEELEYYRKRILDAQQGNDADP